MPCRIEKSSDAATAKANEFAVEALKQLLTIAGALLVLTITFMKDILGNQAAAARCFALVPVGWFSLSLSLWWGWVAIADGARRLGKGEIHGYVYGAGMPYRLARLAQGTLFFGIFCLGIFVMLNLAPVPRSPKETPANAPNCQAAPVPQSMK